MATLRDLTERGTVLYFFPHILYESPLLTFNIYICLLMLITVDNAEPQLTKKHAVLKLNLHSEVRGKP